MDMAFIDGKNFPRASQPDFLKTPSYIGNDQPHYSKAANSVNPSTQAQVEGLRVDPELRFFTPPSEAGTSASPNGSSSSFIVFK